VLLVVSLILVLMSVLVLSWGREWRTEVTLSANFLEVRKSRHLAEAGIYYALGKLVRARAAETARQTDFVRQKSEGNQDIWRLDQQPRILRFPTGEVEVRIADEGGKINLNQATEEILFRLFSVLGNSELQCRTMVDAIIDWRGRDDQPRPYGAKSNYYLRLEPPYVAKNGRFETVEELAWVKGFENSAIIPRLTDFFTVQGRGLTININTARREVLRAAGFSEGEAAAILTARQRESFQQVQDFGSSPSQLDMSLSFNPSLFFTITSKGMIKTGKGPYTIKAIVRLLPSRPSLWSFVSWLEDFPG
jgi:general secretion pathway protein K